MVCSLRKMMYHGLCACASLAIASYAIVPVSAATAGVLGYRGGQSCPASGCHNQQTTCSGSDSCSNFEATACFTGPHDRNGASCGSDSGLCSSSGCGGLDIVCGGR